ncbi:hypothetical protein [Amycolatopsis sp. FDAARGOS 1241]|uniref:hypothetical protein n=1 Tax=Amycolatopsis sp. FDAARGOS 1241 TaxID=2778070 RepID=UPI0019514661|nr:hypothetical protein [Amycolatopsis sp. FDAARGOS 1241]QRP43072.1 hypothetical protein I6J71_26980 [Amycolatopsis sp. FDAARGOS 1241]
MTLTVTRHLAVPRDKHRSPTAAELQPLAPRAYDHEVVTIETAILMDAIDIANAIRHGNENHGELEQRHLDALFELDKHPRLNGMLDEEIEAYEHGDTEANNVRAAIAQDYLSLLDTTEIARRVEAAGWFAPAPGEVGEDLQDCPVCDQKALISEGGIDMYGIGTVPALQFGAETGRTGVKDLDAGVEDGEAVDSTE